MEEKTKELKRIEDLEEKHEDDIPTKKLETVSEEEILNEEVVEEETEPVLEEQKVEETTPPVEKKEKKKISKKKLFIIIGISIAVLIILIVVLLLLLKPKKEEKTKVERIKYTEYGETIYKSLEKGDLDKIIKENLEKNKIKASTVTLLNIDIDSDKRQDLVVFASENNNKILLNLNVKDEVSYENSYKLDSKEGIGYLYSISDDNFYWYVENGIRIKPLDNHSNYIEIEDVKNKYSYYLITKEYKNENIIEYGLKYNFDKKLDIEELEEKAITISDMQKDIKISKEDAKKKLENDIEEQVKKDMEKAEKAAKERKEKFLQEIPEETARKVLLVAITNYLADDTKDEEGNYDVSKFHDSAYDGEFKITVKSEGECEAIEYAKYWHCKNMNVLNSNSGYMVLDSQIYKEKSDYVIKKFVFVNSDEKFEVDGNVTSLDPYPFLKVSEDLIK